MLTITPWRCPARCRYSQHTVHCKDCKAAMQGIDEALPVLRSLMAAALLVGVLAAAGLLQASGGARWFVSLGCGLLAAAAARAAAWLAAFRQKLVYEPYVHAFRN